MHRRLFGWWHYAEEAVSLATNPRTDAAAADGDLRAAIRASRLFASVRALAGAAEAGWRNAYVHRPVDSVARAWRACSTAGRVRAIGACIAVACATALVLQLVESPQDGPLRWMLPMTIGLVSVVVAAAADPIARAWGDRRT